jgi:hypothetical protein
MPSRWEKLGIKTEGLKTIEDDTDENGLYLEYQGRSIESLYDDVTQALTAAGYRKSHVAFEGKVLGFEKQNEQLAVKVDQFGDYLYLAVFNERGKDPVLHGVVFGKYTLGPPTTGDAAKEQLLKELEQE